MASKMKRFTVSLDQSEYLELRSIAEIHRPRLSLQYVVRYALQRFLDEYKGAQLQLPLESMNEEEL